MVSASLPRVSVCLPVFNGAKYLEVAIKSVIAQSFSDWELIISDDTSDDESLEIIERYACTDSRIRFWRNSNRVGLFANYNLCLQAARGRYIKPFAQDDILHSNMLERLVQEMEEHPGVSLISSARAFVCRKGMRLPKQFPQVCDYLADGITYSGSEVIKRALLSGANFIGEPTSVIFRRHSADSGFDSAFYQLGDLEYWFRILKNGRYRHLTEELCSFRVHSESTSSTNSKFFLYSLDLLLLGRKYKRFLWEAGFTQHQFNDMVIARVAADLRERGLGFQEALLSMDPDYFVDFDRFTSCNGLSSVHVGLLELSLHALARVNDSGWHESGANRTAGGGRYASSVLSDRRHTIYTLERKLQAYLSSASWRLTRVLREINSTFLEQRDLDNFNSEDANQYERFLRRTIWRVKHSRSWKLTVPLRAAYRCFTFCLPDGLRSLGASQSSNLGPPVERDKLVGQKDVHARKEQLTTSTPAERSALAGKGLE